MQFYIRISFQKKNNGNDMFYKHSKFIMFFKENQVDKKSYAKIVHKSFKIHPIFFLKAESNVELYALSEYI